MKVRHPAKELGKEIVVVLGGGFGGLNTAKQLANQPDVFVILIDKRNHHLFQPLLYQVATAGLSPGDIAVPIRSQFAHTPNVEVHSGEINGVDLKEQFIKSSGSGEGIEYDYLVLACGAQHAYFGHDEWEEFAPGLKTLEQATEIRRRILLAFEEAERTTDSELRKYYLTFVIVGGGPTGVELAGAIGEMSRFTLARDFRSINARSARVILLEAGPRILPSFSEAQAARAASDLHGLGVEVQT